jgi:hypothetical protein
LQDDFELVLDKLGLERVRSLSHVNPTADKERPFLSYYTADVYEHAARIFGPFMRKWDYRFPSEWGKIRMSPWTVILFYALAMYRNQRRYLRHR